MSEERKHAKLSASGAARWMACPRSVALEEEFENQDTEYSREGTEAHALAEKLLSIFKAEGRREFTAEELGENRDMSSAVLTYLDYIFALYDSLLLIHLDTALFIETRVNFEKYVPEGFGTCDCIIIADEVLHTIDYKHGRGVRVEVNENPQPRLYALGALEMFSWQYPIRWVQTHIVQPRINNIDSETMTVEELLAWGEDEVKPKALLAYNDEGDFVPGDHCRFCKARAICKARARKSLGVIAKILGGK